MNIVTGILQVTRSAMATAGVGGKTHKEHDHDTSTEI